MQAPIGHRQPQPSDLPPDVQRDMVPDKTDINRITIRPCTGSPTGTDAPVRSADVFDDDGLTEQPSHPLGKDPPDHIRSGEQLDPHDPDTAAKANPQIDVHRAGVCRL
jgi:hypothetical protein